MMLLGLAFAALVTQYYFQESYLTTWSRFLRPNLEWQAKQRPSVGQPLNALLGPLTRDDPRVVFQKSFFHRIEDLPIPSPVALDVAVRRRVDVASSGALAAAIATAQPGDEIILANGRYDFIGKAPSLVVAGRPDAPIIIRAANRWQARIYLDTVEGFLVTAPDWIIKDLSVTGVCANDSDCEHAFHVVGKAKGTRIIGNRVRNFNAHIKVNLEMASRSFPDDGLVEGNIFFNDAVRVTSNPVTPVNIDGASNWVVKSNVIADFAKNSERNHTSYGAFMKAAGKNGSFIQNLVVCEWAHKGGERIGLSFGGGGGEGAEICADNACAFHHAGGTMKANIIAYCPNDVGIYVNNSPDTLLDGNIIHKTRGIDVRFPRSNAVLRNNKFDGRLLLRDGATLEDEGNEWSRWCAALLLDVTQNPVNRRKD